MESSLRPDAPAFVPSFIGDTSFPPNNVNKVKKRKKQRPRRTRRHTKPTSSPRLDGKRSESSTSSNVKTNPQDTPFDSFADDENESITFDSDTISFASIVRREPVVTVENEDRVTPAGWTVLRPKKSTSDMISYSVGTEAPLGKCNQPSRQSECLQKFRQKLWESMDRIQQERPRRAPAHEDPYPDPSAVFSHAYEPVNVESPPTRRSILPKAPPVAPRPIDCFTISTSSDGASILEQLEQGLLPTKDGEYLFCLELLVRMDRPAIVRQLCLHWLSKCPRKATKRNNGVASATDTCHPVLLAVKLGHDECLEILLSAFLISHAIDSDGNTALHLAALHNNLEIFRILWHHLFQETKLKKKNNNPSSAYKFISRRNARGQTFLHVACENSASDMVDWILRQLHHHKARSILSSKWLLLQDEDGQTPLLTAIAAGSTDCVMHFFMLQSPILVGVATCCCPLRWAVRSVVAPVEMVALLLEFHSGEEEVGMPAVSKQQAAATPLTYDWHGALLDCLERRTASLEILRMLVDAGANLFSHHGTRSGKNSIVPLSDVPFGVAIETRNAAAIGVMLDAYDITEDKRRAKRRRDPKLKLQPESFFAGIEEAKDTTRKRYLRQGLVSALSHMHFLRESPNDAKSAAQTALVLYQRGTTLDSFHLQLLEDSLKASSLKLIEKSTPHERRKRDSPLRPGHNSNAGDNEYRNTRKEFLSLPWVQCVVKSKNQLCELMTTDSAPLRVRPRVLVKANDGGTFLVHDEVFADRCDKLAGSIRFAKASRQFQDNDVEVETGISSQQCRWLIEHVYCGSMISSLPASRVECCETLLELYLVAEEFLCSSLMKECEMRLVAPEELYNSCFCLDCWSRQTVEMNLSPFHGHHSFLITEETVLNVLSLLTELRSETHRFENATYNIQIKTESAFLEYPPMEYLWEVTTRFIIGRFGKIRNSESWSTHIELVEQGSSMELSLSFLQFCVEEMAEQVCVSRAQKVTRSDSKGVSF